MRLARLTVLIACAALGACGSLGSRDAIEGNNTGGVIPPSLAQGDVQGLADAHCAKWGSAARITFTRAETGGEVVFICVDPSGQPTWTRPKAG